MTDVVKEVVGKRRYPMRFQDGLEKQMLSNQLTIVVARSEVEEEIEVREVEMIPEVREEFGSYHWVYISLHFIKEDGVEKREEQLGVKTYPDQGDIKEVFLDDERERHWRMIFEDNNGGANGTKALLHANNQDV